MAKESKENINEQNESQEDKNWADMINVREDDGADADSDEFDGAKVLNQDEIDSLFGKNTGKNDRNR